MRLLTALDSTATTPGLRRVSLVVCEGRVCGAWRWVTYFEDWRAAKILLPLVAIEGSKAEAVEMARLIEEGE